MRAAWAGVYSIDEASAKSPARTTPTGVATTNPAFGPVRMTAGVASAWSEKKPAAVVGRLAD